MQKTPLKRFSVLTVVLLAVSAITAAALPVNITDIQFDDSEDNGTLLSDSGWGGGGSPVTCTIDDDDVDFSCHATASDTTDSSQFIFSDLLSPTAGNTSNSWPNNGHDTTSHD